MIEKQSISIDIKDNKGIKRFGIDGIKEEPENAYLVLIASKKNRIKKISELFEILCRNADELNNIHIGYYEEKNKQGHRAVVWIQFDQQINLNLLGLEIVN